MFSLEKQYKKPVLSLQRAMHGSHAFLCTLWLALPPALAAHCLLTRASSQNHKDHRIIMYSKSSNNAVAFNVIYLQCWCKNNGSRPGTLYVWRLHSLSCSLHVCMGFLWEFQFPLTSQSCAPEVNWCVYIVPVSVSVGECEDTPQWKGVLFRVVPTFHPELPE